MLLAMLTEVDLMKGANREIESWMVSRQFIATNKPPVGHPTWWFSFWEILPKVVC